MDKNKFPVIEVEPSGKPNWSGGAWCLAWTYTEKGNFLLKGFYGDIQDYIKQKGWKCWSVINLYHTNSKYKFAYYRRPFGNYRTTIKTFKCDFFIISPSLNQRKMKPRDYRFKVNPENSYSRGLKGLVLKRLPNQFVEFEFEKGK
jgi:hypothetical protein